VFHSTEVFYEVADRISQGAYTIVNATASWRPQGSNFQLKLWGRNLTNKDYIESTTITQGGDEATYAPPRAGGFEVDYKF
jgi:iron complex outermembrane receptor protein